MDLTTMTVEQIEALGYNQVKLLNQTQHNLSVIEAELEKRRNAPPQAKPAEE